MGGIISGNKPVSNTIDLGGDIVVDPPVFTAGTLQSANKQVTTANITIPAGAKSIEIFNNSDDTVVTVNGANLQPQARYALESFQDMVTYKVDFCPEVIIVNPNNVELWIKLVYPSSSLVNPNTVI